MWVLHIEYEKLKWIKFFYLHITFKCAVLDDSLALVLENFAIQT